jgi:bacteriochlorophyll C20 methyltransferase
MMCQNAFKGLNPGGRIFILDMNISDPDAPNYDYLTHYVCAIGLQFSVLDFKSHTLYLDILRSVGFEDITCTEAYDHVLYQATKPNA